jgi:hypothetical protein
MQCSGETNRLLLAERSRVIEESLVKGNNVQEVPGVTHHVFEVTHKYWFIGETRGSRNCFTKGVGTGYPGGVRFKSIQNNTTCRAIYVQ